MPDIFINTERPIDRSIVAGINQPQKEALKQSYVAGSSYDVNLYFVKNDGTYDSRSGGASTDVQFAISTISEPKSGTFTLTDGTDTTAQIEYGASAKDVQDALNALNSDTGPNTGTASLVDVDKRNDGQYTITWRELGTMTALSGASVSLFPESSPTASVAISGSSTEYAQQVVEIVRQPAIFQQSWAEITNGHSATVALDSTRLLQSLVVDQGKPFFIEVKLDGETVAKEVITVEESTMPASAYSGRVIQSILDDFATNPGSNAYFSASAWRTALSINNVDNTSDANKPISTATQTALDAKASAASLTSHTTDTSNPHSVTAAQVGLGSVDNTSDASKPISTATQTALDDKASSSSLTSHTSDTSNPHSVTAAQVGLGNADNTADADKPVSTAQQTALDLKADDADLTSHTTDTSNPHSVTATQVGLGSVDNTSDADKPISTAQQTALDLKADDADLTSHTGNTSNPHSVTATQVGLGSVDNTSDADKPVSTAQQAALDDKQDILAEGAFLDGDKTRLDNSVISDTAGVTGADQVTNLISLTQAEYDAITPGHQLST